ncbi:hypothetical protein V6B16_08245 [Salinimicrobium catena]|uniref:hypothetical protein n=1 Tax=Salinimicrobium catena TaxID=390640 RepID=UPI002FE467E3
MTKMKAPLTILFFLTLLFASCVTDESTPNEIEGTFYGTLSMESEGTKSYVRSEDAVAEIRKTGDFEVEVHCYSNSLDTIFRLNYFEHEENFKVCLTGSDFEDMYHTTFMGPMEMQNMHGTSQWMNHLQTMHEEEDTHFGEFHSADNSFEYTFLMGDSLPNMHFKGHRDQN